MPGKLRLPYRYAKITPQDSLSPFFFFLISDNPQLFGEDRWDFQLDFDYSG